MTLSNFKSGVEYSTAFLYPFATITHLESLDYPGKDTADARAAEIRRPPIPGFCIGKNGALGK
jgi:hypothetical protein